MKLQFNAVNQDGTAISMNFDFGQFGEISIVDGVVETADANCAAALVATGNFKRLDADVVADAVATPAKAPRSKAK